jgi:hypothetical protein
MAKGRSSEGDNLIDGDDRTYWQAGRQHTLSTGGTTDQHGLLQCTQWGIMKGSCKADGQAASSTAYGSRAQEQAVKNKRGRL